MTGRLHESEMKEGRSEHSEEAQKKPGSRLFSRLRPAIAALAITAGVGACGTYENEGIPALTGDIGTGGSVSDGGGPVEEDGGAGADSGTGGSDGGSGGMDGGSGGHDAGTGGLDAGTGGMDSGTGGDGGMGGMDSGTGGDGGSGGDAGIVCMGLGTGNYSGNILTGASQAVGGYTFTYVGESGGQAMLDISCSGGVLFNDYLFPEDFVTNVIDMGNGKQFNITPHAIAPGGTNITIQVLNYP